MEQEISKPNGKGVKGIICDALESYGGPFNVGESYAGPYPTVLCLLLDSKWFLPKKYILKLIITGEI